MMKGARVKNMMFIRKVIRTDIILWRRPKRIPPQEDI
jgi:hypothetical protein